MSDINYVRILRRHGESVDGYVLDEAEFEAAVEEAINAGAGKAPSGIIIDCAGRVWMDGFHVAWLNRKCSTLELSTFAQMLGASTSLVIEDMVPVVEVAPELRAEA